MTERPKLWQGSWHSRTKGLAMLFLVGILCALVSPGQTEVVSRINYGIVFTHDRTVDAVYDYWTHTYQVNLPVVDNITAYKVVCDDSNPRDARCRAYEKAFLAVDRARAQYTQILNNTLKHIEIVLPKDSIANSQSRSKRKVLGFVSEIGQSVFGFATQGEISRISAHIMALESKQGNSGKVMAQFTEDLSSFMTLSQDRHNKLRQAVTDNHEAISSLATTMQTLESSIHDDMEMAALLVQELYHTMALQTSLQEFLSGIHDLLNQKLSSHIIPYQDIVSISENINSKLLQQRSRLKIKTMTTNEIYGTMPFVWTMRNNSLYVTLKFPLVASMSRLKVYKIYYLSIPFNSSIDHATKLSNDAQYVAFSTDHSYYGFPTFNMFQGNILDAQTYNLPLYPSVEPSCITAIFFQETLEIKRLCDFRVILGSIQPSVTHLNQGQYMVSNVTNLFLTCPGGPQRLPGCNFCIFEVPCLCDFSTDHLYFPPRLAHCVSENDTATLVHPVNLAVLMHFYDQERLLHIQADTVYKETPLVKTPDMHLFTHNLSKIVASDKLEDLSLKRIAHSMREDKQVFKTLSDPVLDSLSDLQSESIFSWKMILTLVNASLIILLICTCIFLYHKIRVLHMALLALAVTPKVQSTGIDILPTTPLVTPQTPIYITQSDDMLQWIIISLLSVLLIIIVFKYLTHTVRRAMIALEISNGSDCVMVPLLSVPHCPKFYHCQSGDNYDNFEVEGWFRPIFTWNKGSLVITHLLDRSRPQLPDRVPVSILTGLRLRRMFRQTIYAYLMAEHANYAFQLNICPLSCRECSAKLNVVESPAAPPNPEAPQVDMVA